MPSDSIITVTNLNGWYSSLHALKGASMEFQRNSITAMIGASGSGKSTLLRCLNRMLDHVPSVRIEGGITIGGELVTTDKTDVVSLRRQVGMVFQNPTPFPKSIYDNVAYGLKIQRIGRGRGLFGWMKPRRLAAANVEKSDDPVDQAVVRSLKEASLWEEVKDRLHQSAYRLSGGQQQRLCIARAIAIRPSILLLDEPCPELDPISPRHVEETLLKLKQQYTIVIVTHNMHQARRIADRVAFFHAGELIEEGLVGTIFGSPAKTLTQEYVRGAFG